jgi:Flp pilus assembly pilin Flp
VYVCKRTNEIRGFVMNILKRLIKDEKGMEAVEWAVLAALIAAGLIGVIITLGSNVLTAFTDLRDRG